MKKAKITKIRREAKQQLTELMHDSAYFDKWIFNSQYNAWENHYSKRRMRLLKTFFALRKMEVNAQ